MLGGVRGEVAHRMSFRAGGAIADLVTSTSMGASARAGTDPRDAA